MDKIFYPVTSNYPITQKFGENFIWNGQWAYPINSGHPGIDFGTPMDTPVMACSDGQVINASDRKDGYGKLVILLHDWGVSLYGHNGSFKCSVGDYIKCGTIISLSDNTGFSTASHLHFEIQINGVPIDPLPYMTYNLEEVMNNTITIDLEILRYWFLRCLRREPDESAKKAYIGQTKIEKDFVNELLESDENRDNYNRNLKFQELVKKGVIDLDGNVLNQQYELVTDKLYRLK